MKLSKEQVVSGTGHCSEFGPNGKGTRYCTREQILEMLAAGDKVKLPLGGNRSLQEIYDGPLPVHLSSYDLHRFDFEVLNKLNITRT